MGGLSVVKVVFLRLAASRSAGFQPRTVKTSRTNDHITVFLKAQSVTLNHVTFFSTQNNF
jgi:hypothetical protein